VFHFVLSATCTNFAAQNQTDNTLKTQKT